MKKLSIILSILWCTFVTACTSDEPILTTIEDNSSSSYSSHNRTVEEAIEIASDNYADFFNGNSRAISLGPQNVIVFGSNKASRSAAVDTALYVVNFGDNNGFAIVAADKDSTPLLALTDDGEINDIDEIENPGLKMFMDACIDYISGGGNIPKPTPGGDDIIVTPDPIQYMGEVVTTTTRNFEPKVKVKWGQSWPTGYFCPNKISGCVMTAGVQALSYYELPTSINLTYPDCDKTTQTFNWASMKENIISSSSTPSDLDNLQNVDDYLALSRLSREIGHRINADYSDPNGTGASISNLRTYLKKIVPGIEISQLYDTAPNVPKLKRWDLIIMRGATSNEENATGHAWIIDGYKERVDHVKVYNVTNPLFDENGKFIPPAGEPSMEYDSVIYSLSHINWGWNGKNNGYYDAGVYNANKCKEYDSVDHYLMLDNYKYNFYYFTMYK